MEYMTEHIPFKLKLCWSNEKRLEKLKDLFTDLKELGFSVSEENAAQFAKNDAIVLKAYAYNPKRAPGRMSLNRI